MKILLIEDDETTRLRIAEILKREKYEIIEKTNGSDGLLFLKDNPVDLIILDILLPGIDGYYVCSQIRKNPEMYGTPLIMMLTSKERTEDLVLGFDKGADDYLKKPFDERELSSRTIALLRRKGITSRIYKYREIIIDTEKIVITENGDVIETSRKEYDLLLYFVINKGITITREKATTDIWEVEYYDGLRTLDTYIKVLKKKFISLRENLVNVRGFGYKLENE